MDNGASSYRRFCDDGDENGLAEIIRDYKDGLIFYLNSFTGNIRTAEEHVLSVSTSTKRAAVRFAGRGHERGLPHTLRVCRHAQTLYENNCQ